MGLVRLRGLLFLSFPFGWPGILHRLVLFAVVIGFKVFNYVFFRDLLGAVLGV